MDLLSTFLIVSGKIIINVELYKEFARINCKLIWNERNLKE